MIESSSRGILRETYGRSGIGLGIAVDEKGGLFGNSEAGSQVHGCGGLSDPALLICYSDNSSQIISPSENLTKRVAGCKMFHVEHLCGERSPARAPIVPRGTLRGWLDWSYGICSTWNVWRPGPYLTSAATIRRNVPRETWGLLQD